MIAIALPSSSRVADGFARCLLIWALLLLACGTGSAGDVLRGGTPAAASGQRSSNASQSAAAAAAQARTTSRDNLARTTRALQDAQRLQIDARAAALRNAKDSLGINPNVPGNVALPNVPNGLGVGGLEVDPGVAGGTASWTGASLPSESKVGESSNVKIRQTAQTALLSWKTFNVGRKTEVTFDQRDGGADVKKWVAFNHITDPSGVPSQILGSIRADGQVYLINRNGIIFGPNSQVSMPSFVASSLPVNTNLISRGLLNNPDAQFLFSGIDLPQGKSGTPPFVPGKPFVASGRYGDVTVQPGAVISSPTDAARSGGKVMLVGANVTNGGTILTPDGQTILAAGLQVGIDGHPSADASLRGLDVFVGAIAPVGGTGYGGRVTQTGIVQAPRGNITLAGSQIEQLAALDSSTSVSYNGRIDLQAIYNSIPNSGYNPTNPSTGRPFLPIATGSVTFGANSVTRILPETDSNETVIGTQLALRSAINVTAKTVELRSHSMLQANGGDISVYAGSYNLLAGTVPISTFVRSGGQIYLDRGSLIDTAGSTVAEIPVSRMFLNLELRGAEFARSPLQRNGALRGVPITVDSREHGTYKGFEWVGTPLGDVRGYLNLIQRSVAELTADGGNVSLVAGDSVVMQPGSQVNVSGGVVSVGPGVTQSTMLRSGGTLLDIKNATPDRVYDGIYNGESSETSTKWGVTRRFSSPLALLTKRWEPGYSHGASGGTVTINAASVALDGDLLGRTINGEKQLDSPAPLSALKLSFLSDDTSYPTIPPFSPTPPSIVFGNQSLPRVGAFSVDPSGNPLALPSARINSVSLSPSLLTPGKGGFGKLSINNPDGNIDVPKGVTLQTAPAGSLNFIGSNVKIDGNLSSPGGDIHLTANNLSTSFVNQQTVTPTGNPSPVPGRGEITIGSGSKISTAGLRVDQSPGATRFDLSIIAGGSIDLHGFNVTLATGSLLDASGGVKVENRTISYGDGGSIKIAAGTDTSFPSVLGGRLVLNGDLLALSGATGGSLSLTAPSFQIGGGASHPDEVRLSPDFFSKGGFADFALSATGIIVPPSVGAGGVEQYLPGVLISGNTRIRPVVEGLFARLNAPSADGSFTVGRIVRPEGLRTPASLKFEASGAVDPFLGLVVRGDIVLDQGASIQTDALGAVTFNAQTVTVLGSVLAPGGSISVDGAKSLPTASSPPGEARATVYLGPSARLSTAGKVVPLTGERGIRSGFVTAGGSIKIGGNIVAEQGAILNASGTSGTLDLPGGYSGLNETSTTGFEGESYTPTKIETSGGYITLTGGQMLYSDLTLLAKSGGRSANGGTLAVSSGRFISSAVFTSADINLQVKQSGASMDAAKGSRGIGLGLFDANGQSLPGVGTFVADQLQGSGIHSVTLGGNVQFNGDVTLSVPGQLTVASGGVLATNDTTLLRAAAVKLGLPIPRPFLTLDPIIPFIKNDNGLITQLFLAPTHGTGRLEIEAGLIETGNFVLQNIGSARFSAPRGDIRGAGNLLMAGDMVLEAGQIYPTTAGKFNIYAYNYTAGGTLNQGSITIQSGSARSLPWSAGGALSLQSSNIVQGGTLRAPMGSITLGWDGTGNAPVNPVAGSAIATPTTQQITLSSGSVTSVSGTDPLTGRQLVLPYGVSFDGLSWIDPAGNDITVGGAPSKTVRLSGQTIDAQAGSTLDLRGGGDFFAYRWVQGNGGPEDILGDASAFAVIPGYDFNYAPFAPFNNRPTAINLQGAPGYVNDSLRPGDQVTIGSGSGLPAGTYTLLPARYALLDGAFLLTPQSGAPTGTLRQPDGAVLVNGYRSNNLDPSRAGVTQIQSFEVASNAVVNGRAEYQLFMANSYLRDAAISRDLPAPRLPLDAGSLGFSSTASLQLQSQILGTGTRRGRGSFVDISSPINILVNADGSGGGPGVLALSSRVLNRIGAESLLIGGFRTTGSSFQSVTATSNAITVDNQGAPLVGSDLILTAKQTLTVAANAEILGQGQTSLDSISLGTADVIGSGDGALIRVSGGGSAPVTRVGVSSSNLPTLTLGNSAHLEGRSLTLDSTSATSLSPAASILAEIVALNSGQISLLLDSAGGINPTTGLILPRSALQTLEDSASSISLLSYNTIDIYGNGTFGGGNLQSLSLQANAIRGFNTASGVVRLVADTVSLGNASGREISALPGSSLNGQLVIDAEEAVFQSNKFRTERFASVEVAARTRILNSGSGSFAVSGSLTLNAPLITSTGAASHSISSVGGLSILNTSATAAGNVGGLGAALSLTGKSVTVDTDIVMPSGKLSILATGGDVILGSSAPTNINLSGRALTFLDETRYTSGGSLNIGSETNSVTIANRTTINLSATGLADAGFLNVRTPKGLFAMNGTLVGSAAVGRTSGSFSLDASQVSGNDLASIDALLNIGSFNQLRDYRIRSGNLAISGVATARTYRVGVDSGSLTVSGQINASGQTGGSIDLAANGNLSLQTGAVLDASAQTFDSAGKGGSVSLAAGTSRNGVVSPTAELNLAAGRIELGVASQTASSAANGQFTGTLNLRAPQDQTTYTTIQAKAIGTTIQGASAIQVEAFRLYDQSASGLLNNSLRDQIRSDAQTLFGSAGSVTASYNAMLSKLDPSKQMNLILIPGAEIINASGSLTMGSASSPASEDWNLASFRFGPLSAAGALSIRASQNITFFNALSDGFTVNTSAGSPNNTLWMAPLSPLNPNLPANRQSWSYRITAGADLSSANFRSVLPGNGNGAIGQDSGFFEVGKDAGAASVTGATNALTSSLAPTYFQVVRTGSGDIDINAARTVRLLNPFASIYTAGTQVATPTKIYAANDFVTPILNSNLGQGALGRLQQAYGAYYSMAGGNLNISAGDNLERKTRNNSGLIDDSSRQLPNNWLYRRGYVSDSGNFASLSLGSLNDPGASTSWWIDFSNFFQTSGALGGGHVSLTAGNDIRNFDAVVPTNARAPRGNAASAQIQELGGGDLTVRAGRNLDGGIYYAERGTGRIAAGSQITTNGTRSPSPGLLQSLNNPASATLEASTWLPTTLFLGKSSFDVSAASDILMGPMSNPFLLPQGQNNGFWYKTYFSTFNENTSVRITSLSGNVTLRNEATLADRTAPADILQTWMERQNLFTTGTGAAAYRQPWLRLAESSIQPFLSVSGLRPPNLEVTSLAGSLNLIGSMSLFPSATGQLEMIAGGGSINGLQPSGRSNFITPGQTTQTWRTATINISDADPATFRTPTTPFAYVSKVGNARVSDNNDTRESFLESIDGALLDSGSITGIYGVTQTKLALHAPGILHRNDLDPVRVYALGGNLSGFNLFSPKASRIHASNDITDISFYLQNNRPSDLTVVSAGRDIVPYNAASPLRKAANAISNLPASNSGPLAGDIHIGGPGMLQILAGRNLDLGTGTTNTDGTGSGVVTLGNIRNLSLPFAGADLFAGAGLGTATSLLNSRLRVQTFIDQFILSPEGSAYLKELGVTNFSTLDSEQKARVALEVFYLVLRDAGRSYNDPDSPGFGTYTSGFAAISALFGPVTGRGDISAQTRNFRTRTGGDIDLFAPNGGLTLANTLLANAAVPPGIVTEAGGKVSIFTNQSVDIGVGRIFTLRGGDLLIWSSKGDIAAGAASKTVASAPPTRVVLDPQSGAVETDLAGLSTGGGIGVLAAVANVAPGNVDLIAPSGIIDAGDAGIRVTGNINLAATAVVNAGNISVGGSSSGVPAAPVVAAPSLGGLSGASSAAAASTNAAATSSDAARKEAAGGSQPIETVSIFTVEVLGYGGGGDDSSPDDEEAKNRRG
ncbi:MAG: Filamentous hemagglutinin family outer membrane protein [Verrucomicrobia bacterium]|nr:MAG: Filamentous hemagglutinin family outer membrane protein [Verrucomicrobiota bacterium]